MADERDIPHFNKMANESKQTATEWLFEKLWETPKDKLTWYAILEQANQMEREQIIGTFNEGALDGLQLGEQYYKQTFGK
jgi:hypothetical protein